MLRGPQNRTAQEYWDSVLTHQGREKCLLAVGQALGYQFPTWRQLPVGLRRQLKNFWGKIEAGK